MLQLQDKFPSSMFRRCHCHCCVATYQTVLTPPSCQPWPSLIHSKHALSSYTGLRPCQLPDKHAIDFLAAPIIFHFIEFSRFKFSTQRKLRKQPTKMCDVFAVDCCWRSMWEKIKKSFDGLGRRKCLPFKESYTDCDLVLCRSIDILNK